MRDPEPHYLLIVFVTDEDGCRAVYDIVRAKRTPYGRRKLRTEAKQHESWKYAKYSGVLETYPSGSPSRDDALTENVDHWFPKES